MLSPALALSIVLVGLAISLRVATGTWLHPASFFAAWWCLAGITPMIAAPNEPVSPGAVAWVIAACLAVSLGAVAGNRGFTTRRLSSPREVSVLEMQLIGWPMLIAILLGMLSNLIFAASSGVSLADVMDIQRLVVVSNRLYVARFSDLGAPVAPPRMVQAFLPFVYLAPALGGMVFVMRSERRWKLAAMATMIPAVTVTVLQTTKAAVLFSATLWLSSYFAFRLRLGLLKVITRGHVIVAGVFALLAAALFFGVSFARMASTDASLIDIVRVKLVTAAFGHMSIFSHWLSDYWHQPFNPTLGAYTLAGPLELMGLKQRMPGLFENVIELIAGETSNIYTGFRPLIEDFTIPGAIAILVILGLVSGVAFRAVNRGNWGAVPVLAAAYMTMLWTPITWFWVYNSLTATVVAIGLIVLFVRSWRRARHTRPLSRNPIVSSAQ
jgi:oligosaccharide repeat unit polymerase